MALKGRFRIRGAPSRPWIVCEAALIKADARHQIDASTTPMLCALVDPESEFGGTLFECVTQDITPIKKATVTVWRRQLGDPVSLDSARVESWFRSVTSRRQLPRLHPGVRKVLQCMREELDDHGRLSLRRMAAIAGLSDSRLMHVFTTSVGIPPRPYILWVRFQRAYGEMLMGATLTEAAHRAGFADAAHFKPNNETSIGRNSEGPHQTRAREAGLVRVGPFDHYRASGTVVHKASRRHRVTSLSPA
jgi:AraC-like DNA-binding protein